MSLPRNLAVFGAAVLLSSCAARAQSTPVEPRASFQVDDIVHDVCGKTIVLLGEPPTHGFGRTMALKSALVRRLVDQCHFNAFFIESGIYDFLDIRKKLRSGRDVTAPMLAAAIGGLWATHEVKPLIPFLLEKATAGRMVLGGLDDQIGRGTYAARDMSEDLVRYLQGNASQECRSILRRHLLWRYDADSPYGTEDKSLIVGCLDRIEIAASRGRTDDAQYDLAMVASLRRRLDRDFPQDVATSIDPRLQSSNDRDRSMYENFRWLMSHLPAGSKVIIWAATTHVAKDLSGVPGQQMMVPMGSDIHREFKDRAFTLGFSACSGTYAMVGQPPRQLSAAPEASLEGQAFVNGSSDARYFNSTQMEKFGAITARPTSTEFKTAKWNEVLDGLLVFREERPPTFLKQ
jgi:erythromycin esterase-like protein